MNSINLMDQLADKNLIEQILDDENASDLELNLAERLQSALAELDRLTALPEALDGSNP